MDPDEVKIGRFPRQRRKWRYLGTTVYVSRFCKNFAQFAGPLHDSIKGKRSRESIQLTTNQLSCFEELKKRLTSPPVLSLPDFSQPFGIRMDASNFAIGGVLFQKEGGIEHPIAYTGRKMKPAELNYPVLSKSCSQSCMLCEYGVCTCLIVHLRLKRITRALR